MLINNMMLTQRKTLFPIISETSGFLIHMEFSVFVSFLTVDRIFVTQDETKFTCYTKSHFSCLSHQELQEHRLSSVTWPALKTVPIRDVRQRKKKKFDFVKTVWASDWSMGLCCMSALISWLKSVDMNNSVKHQIWKKLKDNSTEFEHADTR